MCVICLDCLVECMVGFVKLLVVTFDLVVDCIDLVLFYYVVSGRLRF